MASRTNTVTSKRFELPALDLNFGSITDGTNIPPPPASPIKRVPTPPRTPSPLTGTTKASNGVENTAAQTNGITVGTKRPADDAPLSPAPSTRPGSIRRLFSRNMLNSAYAEGQLQTSESGTLPSEGRPASRSEISVIGERKSKRGSGWFRRLRSGSDDQSRRGSVMAFEEVKSTNTAPKKPSGPPPPMIPELSELDKDEGGLGNDLFKNIR